MPAPARGVRRRDAEHERRAVLWATLEPHALKLAHVRDEVGLLLLAQLRAQHEVEELDGVLQRQQATIVKVRRAVLDAAQRERLHRPIAGLVDEAFKLQIVHLVISEGHPGVAGGALALAREDLLAAQLTLARLVRIQPAARQEFGGRREIE